MANESMLASDFEPILSETITNIDGQKIVKSKPHRYRQRSLKIYIYRVLKQVHHQLKITKSAMQVVHDIIMDLFYRILDESFALSLLRRSSSKRKILQLSDVKSALHLVTSQCESIKKHAMAEGLRAVEKFVVNYKKLKGQSQSLKSGLVFSVSLVKSMMKRVHPHVKIAKHVPVFVAAVLEDVTCEILEPSGNVCRDLQRICITPRCVCLAIFADDELLTLFGSAHISKGGTIPFIHASLVRGFVSKKSGQCPSQ
jgi:histone H2B